MSEDEKPKLGLRPQLGVKRTTEVSQVKQSFSHGRTHKVVVETKKARVFRKPGDPAPASAEADQPLEPVVEPTAEEPAKVEAPARAQPQMPVAPPPPFVVVTDEPLNKGEPAKPAPKKRASRAKKAVAADAAPEATREAEPIAANGDEGGEAPDGEPRRGWWQRTFGN